MANHQVLDNVTHKDLRVITARSKDFGDNIASIRIFPVEFRRIQAEYPIVFRKNDSASRFEPFALFGLADGENLFLDDQGWHARYVPLAIERQPFLIGFQTRTDGGVPVDEPVVHIDMDSPRVSDSEGEAVFLEQGGISPYLEHINTVLNAVHAGHADNDKFSAALIAHELLEPFTLDVELNDGSKFKLAGFHTINEANLNALDANALANLHKAGHIENLYMAMASIANLATLIDRKNALIQPGRQAS
ncbi:MAG: SapC family protein [Woeseia sp.]